tara:strand:- start:675 stop:1241 length:567 start_codon:yes stop_codon:yes gene_type:complete
MIGINKNIKSSSKGFTLIEIIIVILTIAVFGSITTTMLANATKVYSSSLKKQGLINEARSTFFKIIREASWQKSFSSFAGSNNKKLVIKPADGNSISYEIRQTNDIIQNNDQITGNNNKIITNKVEYSNSSIVYKNSSGNTINIENDITQIKSLELTLKFKKDGQDILFQGKVIPYNLRIGRAMSYHE